MEELAGLPQEKRAGHILITPVAQIRKRGPRGSWGHTHTHQHSPPPHSQSRPVSHSSAAPPSLTPPPGAAHLWQRPLCLPHLDADPDRDAEHGGQGHEPADAVAPGRVGVHVVVLEGLVFDQEENEAALRRDGERSLGRPSAWVRAAGRGDGRPCAVASERWHPACPQREAQGTGGTGPRRPSLTAPPGA